MEARRLYALALGLFPDNQSHSTVRRTPPYCSSAVTPRRIPAFCDKNHGRWYWSPSVSSGQRLQSVPPGWPAQARIPIHHKFWVSQGIVTKSMVYVGAVAVAPWGGGPHHSWLIAWDKWASLSVPSKIYLVSTYVDSMAGLDRFHSLPKAPLIVINGRGRSILVVWLVTANGWWGWFPRRVPVCGKPVY